MRQLLAIKSSFYWQNFVSLFQKGDTPFRGWGRKRSGRLAVKLAQWFHRDYILLEDGFIRSIGLGNDGSLSFSVVEDDIGIYYDATRPSRLEDILSSYDFDNDRDLMIQSRRAIELIENYHISKYNYAPDMDTGLEMKYSLGNNSKKVLVVAQTAADASLRFGLAEQFSTNEMLRLAKEENPDADVYLKVHPDVLSGGKSSDIDIDMARDRCQVIDDDVNSISLLKYFDKVYTKTSQMGFEALLLGKECVCFGMPFYAGWGITDDKAACERRSRRLKSEEIFAAAYILYTKYFNPYSQRVSDIFDAIETIAKYRERDKKINAGVFCFGFSHWKHIYMMPFFKNIRTVNFVNPISSDNVLSLALKKGLDKNSVIYIWGRKEFDELEEYAKYNDIDVYRVEDGFIRSIGLGSDLTQPYSLVIDSRGIYFDPTQESDLEHLLNNHHFSREELLRAKQIRYQVIEEKLSKYNIYDNVSIVAPEGRRVLLVPGQVEDDASVKYGAPEMSNLKLLQEARKGAPEAYILYKPHPDVLVGNRVGLVADSDALLYCDSIVKEVGLDSVLAICDEVHTMTSLVGFEAIMRGIEVHTYGLPFYAGWGLSVDRCKCSRRKRRLELDELAAAALLLYPRYIDPLTKELCEPEVTLAGLKLIRDKITSSIFYQKRIEWHSRISRKIQWLIR